MKKETLFTVGLPASGKTTWALKQVSGNPEKVKRVNKDDLLAMIDGGKYTSNNEKLINKVLIATIIELISETNVETVIVDGCNLQKHIDQVINGLVKFENRPPFLTSTREEVFYTTPQTCIIYNSMRKNPLPNNVIWNMLDRYQKEGRFLDWKNEGEKREEPWIGFDLDGTLAKYDGWKGPDHIGEVVPEVYDMILKLIEQGHRVKIFTARASVPEYIKPIHEWLVGLGLGDLEITNVKDFAMTMLYDDKCVQVEPNTGKLIK